MLCQLFESFMYFLHTTNAIYRDPKTNNILLNQKRNFKILQTILSLHL